MERHAEPAPAQESGGAAWRRYCKTGYPAASQKKKRGGTPGGARPFS
jgi:hypothetical protein